MADFAAGEVKAIAEEAEEVAGAAADEEQGLELQAPVEEAGAAERRGKIRAAARPSDKGASDEAKARMWAPRWRLRWGW